MSHRSIPFASGSLQAALRVSQAYALLTLVGCIGLSGCARTDTSEVSEAPSPVPATVSIIPLRVWIAAPFTDEQIWLRQWLANSEQPLELRSLTSEEILQQPQCECDVLVYPANLMGELQARGWITKLPGTVSSSQEQPSSNENGSLSLPLAWRQQATYGGETLAIPLGCALPLFVASHAYPPTDQPTSWSDVLAVLKLTEVDAPQFDVAGQTVDHAALVDRYLAIVATLTPRDPNYGLLFDLQTMQPRLREDSFVKAARLLGALASQPDGLASVVGNHSQAWSWAATHPGAALAVATPAMLDSTAFGIDSGHIIQLQHASPEGTSRTQLAGWNGGSALLASLASQCRQSTHATALLKWLNEPNTRSVLTQFAPGIESPTPVGGTDSLAWKGQQMLSRIASSAGVSLEPRLPLASAYRRALADALLNFLSGQETAEQALQSADQRWRDITTEAGTALQRRNYEISLGLTL
jgi:ABC-type glycerol-3-phosphate transport system substrate-binding protein